jgi:hypothetical protein
MNVDKLENMVDIDDMIAQNKQLKEEIDLIKDLSLDWFKEKDSLVNDIDILKLKVFRL